MINPTAQSEMQLTGKWYRLAWLPILLLLAAIIAARVAGLSESYRSETLTLVLSFIFYTLVSLGTLFLIGRSFLASGSPGLLLLECGVVLWSLAGTVGDLVSNGDANIDVTIFNIGILLAGLCHLAGATLSLSPQRPFRRKAVWLGVGCAFAMGALWLVSQAALLGWLPVFFIPGRGGTLVRYAVLISATAMFVLSAALLKANQRAARLPFTSWYTLALLTLAVGLFGIMIQLSLGDVVNWLSRTAQWLGGVYLLFAAVASLRESNLPLFPLEKKSDPAYYRDAVAVAMVLAAAAIRLTFLSAMGTHSPYVVFFPAVMFAAIYGGLRPGLLATAVSAILVACFWLEPVNQFAITQPFNLLSIMIFLLSGGMITWVSHSMRRARARAIAAETQALLAAEREKAAEALYEGRAKLEAALASMTDAVFISDAQGRFVEFNDAFATYYRFRNKGECFTTLAEYPNILDVLLPDGTPAPLETWAVTRALRGETATSAEYTLRRKDTGEMWVGSYGFAPIRDKGGAIVGSVVVVRDITERKWVEVERERLLKEARDAQKELSADLVAMTKLQKIGTLFLQEGNLESVLTEIVDAAIAISGADFGNIQLLDSKSSDLKIAAQRGFPQWWVDFWNSVSKGQGACGTALERGERILVEDVEQSPIFAGTPALEIQRKAGVRAVQSTPLVTRSGKPVGMFSTHYKTPHRPGDRTLRLLNLLARHTADIIERAQTEEALRKSHEELEMRVQERTEELRVINEELRSEIDERLRVEVELRESENHLRELSTELLGAQERERKLIAQEIHDSMGASLAAAKFKVESALNEIGDGNPQARAALENVIPILQGTMEEARRIQMSLRPSILDDLGILTTIGWFCRQFESTYPHIRIRQEIDIQEQEVPESLKIVIYRVLQEALNNIAKHSKASVVLLFLRKIKNEMELIIRDSGQGFDLEEVSSRRGTAKGLGLDSMRERAELSGGSFSIESRREAGTVIRATWPLKS